MALAGSPAKQTYKPYFYTYTLTIFAISPYIEYITLRYAADSQYGDGTNFSSFCKTYHIDYALPNDDHVLNEPDSKVMRLNAQCFVCGDHLMNGSINAAMKSGRLAADAITKTTIKYDQT
ncbi:MAG: hypothetical protein WKF68_13305 [Daejeonella sp.]